MEGFGGDRMDQLPAKQVARKIIRVIGMGLRPARMLNTRQAATATTVFHACLTDERALAEESAGQILNPGKRQLRL